MLFRSESLNGISMADAMAGKAESIDSNEQEEKVSNTKQNASTVHQHNYTSAVTKEPCCGENGVKTFTCSCGDSYTESIPALGHQWVAKTEVVNHPSQGHMETQTIEHTVIKCACGFETDSVEAWGAHRDEMARMASEASAGGDIDDFFASLAYDIGDHNYCDETTWETVNNWVVDSEAWDETVTYNVCSVCGAKQ